MSILGVSVITCDIANSSLISCYLGTVQAHFIGICCVTKFASRSCYILALPFILLHLQYMLVSFNKILHIELLLFDLMHDLAFLNFMLIYMYVWCQEKIPRKPPPPVRGQSGGGFFRGGWGGWDFFLEPYFCSKFFFHM